MTFQVNGFTQTKLVEPMLTERWPKNHKLREPKKYYLKYFEPKLPETNSILELIDDLVPEHKPVVMWSGGKDGRVVLEECLKRERVDSVFYIRTNTGVQVTEDFIKDTLQSLGIRLHIREPTPHAFVYVAICLEIGFPGPSLHDMIMSFLKYKTMMKFVQEPQFKKQKCVLMSGVRKEESQRRKINYEHAINLDSGKMWFCCPVFYQSNEGVYKYFIENGLKKSPSYDVYPSSMECECGTFAGYGEMDAIKKLDPRRASFLDWVTEGVNQFGSERAKRHAVWGNGKNSDWSSEEVQEVLTKYFGDGKMFEHVQKISSQACGADCGAGSMRGLLGN